MSDRNSFSASAPDQLNNVRLYLTGSKTVTKGAGEVYGRYQIDLPPNRIFVFDVYVELENDGIVHATPYYSINNSGYLLSMWYGTIANDTLSCEQYAVHSDDVSRSMTTTFSYVIYELDITQ